MATGPPTEVPAEVPDTSLRPTEVPAEVPDTSLRPTEVPAKVPDTSLRAPPRCQTPRYGPSRRAPGVRTNLRAAYRGPAGRGAGGWSSWTSRSAPYTRRSDSVSARLLTATVRLFRMSKP